MGESGHIPLIEVIRGKTVESVHYGSFAVAFSDGRQPIIIGNNQLAKPTVPGITTPKIITRACMVVMELKKVGSTYCKPG